MPGPLDNKSIIDSIAASKLGPAPGAPAPGGAPAPQPAPGGEAPAPAPAPDQKPKADPAPTSMEKAAAKVAPNDPGSEEPAVRFVKLGDREYTEDQLNGTMSRYKDLNFKWQTHKPVIDVAEQVMKMAKEAGHELAPGEVATIMQAAMRAFTKNPTMGGDQKTANQKGDAKQPMGDEVEKPGDDDAAYEQWEKENAVSLPPGFRDSVKTTRGLAEKMDQMMTLFQKVIEGGMAGQKAQENASAVAQQAQTQQVDAATKMIANNLNGAFSQAGLQTDQATRQDFRMFAAQRGYDFPDFMDPELTATVVADYKANKDAPEIARLREVTQRRQAFTGMVEGAPGAAGAAPAPAAGGDPVFAGLVDTAMQRRGMR